MQISNITPTNPPEHATTVSCFWMTLLLSQITQGLEGERWCHDSSTPHRFRHLVQLLRPRAAKPSSPEEIPGIKHRLTHIRAIFLLTQEWSFCIPECPFSAESLSCPRCAKRYQMISQNIHQVSFKSTLLPVSQHNHKHAFIRWNLPRTLLRILHPKCFLVS